MSFQQLVGWCEFYEIEPWGYDLQEYYARRADIRAAYGTLASGLRKGGSAKHPVMATIDDLMTSSYGETMTHVEDGPTLKERIVAYNAWNRGKQQARLAHAAELNT